MAKATQKFLRKRSFYVFHKNMYMKLAVITTIFDVDKLNQEIILPSAISMIRSHLLAMSLSWVIITTVFPLSMLMQLFWHRSPK